MDSLPQKNILCIDLKSFFASCECLMRGLNPFTTPLLKERAYLEYIEYMEVLFKS